MSSGDDDPEPAGIPPAESGAAAVAVEPSVTRRRMWWTKRALGLHVALVLVVPTFVALFWWQVQRVREGNTLSWAYVFEWPFFTGYAVYLWWKLLHDQLEETRPAVPSTTYGGARSGALRQPFPSPDREDPDSASRPATDDDGPPEEQDEELAAYNRYLAQLNASGRPKRW